MKSATSFRQYRPAIITLASPADSCVCAASVFILSLAETLQLFAAVGWWLGDKGKAYYSALLNKSYSEGDLSS